MKKGIILLVAVAGFLMGTSLSLGQSRDWHPMFTELTPEGRRVRIVSEGRVAHCESIGPISRRHSFGRLGNAESLAEHAYKWMRNEAAARGATHLVIIDVDTVPMPDNFGAGAMNIHAIAYSCGSRPQLPSLCGSPDADISPPNWNQYSCSDETTDACLGRSEYTDQEGRGCPGDQLCCPP